MIRCSSCKREINEIREVRYELKDVGTFCSLPCVAATPSTVRSKS